MGAEVKPISQKPVVYFKYKPKEEKLVIECQPIRPYAMTDQVAVDRLNQSEKATSSNRKNPGFKSLAGDIAPAEDSERKSGGLYLLA